LLGWMCAFRLKQMKQACDQTERQKHGRNNDKRGQKSFAKGYQGAIVQKLPGYPKRRTNKQAGANLRS
jgi:hypothetical protein